MIRSRPWGRLVVCIALKDVHTPLSEKSCNLLKWLTPGIGVKRWVGLLMLGAFLVGLGSGLVVLALYRAQPLMFGQLVQRVGASLSILGFIAGIVGLLCVVGAVFAISRSILEPLEIDGEDLINRMVEHRRSGRGPRIVAIGGGTGLPTLLRGVKGISSNLTAIVTVADDGGSSGRLRRDMGVLPPGDFRNNIAALARDEALITQLFQYRFGEGGLEGHSFGNLFITAMSNITGSFEEALVESSRVLAVRGRVLPSTLANVALLADLREAETDTIRRVAGESNIPKSDGAIQRVFLQPDDVPAYPEAVQAILSAEMVVVGPGSLFTSLLPNLLVPGIAKALHATSALKVYVCNVATQIGETDSYSVVDHVAAIERHVGKGLFDVIVANDHLPTLPADANYVFVQPEYPNGRVQAAKLYTAPLTDPKRPWRHDSERLGQVIADLLAQYGRATIS